MPGYARGRDIVTVGGIAFGAMIVFILLFAHMTNRGLAMRRSNLYVRMASADGLRVGDPVIFRGVHVGDVKVLTFTSAGDVVLKVKLAQRVPLTEDAHATLVAIDLFGRQSLVLREGDMRAARLEDGDTLRGVAPQNLTARMSELGNNAERITGDTTVVLLHAALAGMGAATRSIAQLSGRMSALVSAQQESVSALTRDLALVAHNMQTVSDPDALLRLRDNAESTGASLGRAVAQLEATTHTIAQLVAAVDSGQGNAGMLLKDRALYDRTESLLANVEALVVDVKMNPKKYINVKVF